MKSVLQKIVTSHRFSLILLLFVQWAVCLLFSYLPPQLVHALFIVSSLGFGIALLLVYFNKAIGFNTSGQQEGVKARQLITLAGFTAIVFLFYRLFSVFSGSGRSYTAWLPIISWAFIFILLLVRSGKYNSALYHLLTLLFGMSTMSLLCANPYLLNSIFSEPAAMLIVSYYILLIVSFNIHKPVVRGIILGLGLLTAGFIPLFWLLPVLIILWMNEAKPHFMRTMIAFLIVAGGICLLSYVGIKYRSDLNHTNYSSLLSLPYMLAICSALAMTLLYIMIRKRIYYRIFLMSLFKICMALCLLFYWIPAPGLLLVDLFVSIAIFAETGKYHFAGKIKRDVGL